VIAGQVFDLERCLEAIGPGTVPGQHDSLLGVLRNGPERMAPIRRLEEQLEKDPCAEPLSAFGHSESSVKLWAPLPRPNSIRDFLVFEEHLINSTHAYARRLYPPVAWLNGLARKAAGKALLRPPKVWYELPIYYKGNADTVVGPEEPILWPSYTNELDYELEFGVYLWRTGKDISKQDASSHIAGYTVFNDFSARDIQLKEMGGRLGPTKGKDFDTGNVMGPYLVTPDEVQDPYALQMRAYVNDELWSEGNSSKMHFSFEDMIAYVSKSETLHPGDFLGSGTVGTGCGLELDRWLKRGDRVTLEVEKLGRLSNPVAR
jgi:2-keto-4-pentenoate hydratase/2-oxohepta-3-ene-1,7-dioic acid hydratase in catechol pathway